MGVLDDVSVLIVEDEYLIAHEYAATLQEHGARVLGFVPDVASTQALIAEQTPDCVLLDCRLRDGQNTYELAEQLVRRGIPTIFMTGYDASALPPNLQHLPRLLKPVQFQKMIQTIQSLTETHRT